MRIDDNILLGDDGTVSCAHCSATLGDSPACAARSRDHAGTPVGGGRSRRPGRSRGIHRPPGDLAAGLLPRVPGAARHRDRARRRAELPDLDGDRVTAQGLAWEGGRRYRAAQGIGLAYARRLAAEGCHVVLADLDADKCAAAAAKITADGAPGSADSMAVDVSDEASCQQLAEAVQQRNGRADGPSTTRRSSRPSP